MSVLDASVVLKWFVDEEDSDKAIQLREKYYVGEREIVVPDLLLFEVANALRYNPSFTAEEIKEAVRTLFDIGIEIITPTYSLLAKAIESAESLDVTCMTLLISRWRGNWALSSSHPMRGFTARCGTR